MAQGGSGWFRCLAIPVVFVGLASQIGIVSMACWFIGFFCNSY